MDNRQRRIYKVTLVGSAVNVALTVFKFFAGIVGHSSAMIADAVHSLTDLVSDVIVLLFVRIASKPADSDHNYGHAKYETLATLLVGAMLAIVGAGMLWDGIADTVRFFRGVPLEAPNWWALGAALISIVSKEWLFHYTRHTARKVDSQALEANAWHHRSDALTSVGTLVGIGGAMLLGARWRVLDPLAAAFVSVFVIAEAVKLIRPALNELMEKSLDPVEIADIESIIAGVPEITAFHRLRTRRVGANRVVSVHIKMPGDFTLWRAHAVASEVEKRIKYRFGPGTITEVHMEPQRPA